MSVPVLCYIEGSWAFFTTQKLENQWADDWNDSPYEHNAGRPYSPCWHRSSPDAPLCQCESCKRDWDGDKPRWEIIRVAWEGPFVAPNDGCLNSSFSVEQINRGDIAWLRPEPYADKSSKIKPIPAGTTLEEFKKLVRDAGGKVYVEEKAL